MATARTRHAPAHLRNTSLAEQRDRLLVERAALLSPQDRTDTHAGSQATTGPGETDHINAETERLLEAVLDDHARLALDEITAALTRIESGTYGTCQRCGAPIGEDRLDALPRARYCIECQRVSEDPDARS
jgi:DnaK suppressor protein